MTRYCQECGKVLTGRKVLYCGKNCASRACKFRLGKIKQRGSFEPTNIDSFFESEETRRQKRRQMMKG